MRRVTGLVFSARSGGNLSEMAMRLLSRMAEGSSDVQTQLVEVSRYSIQPCNGCQYECRLHDDKGAACPVKDDALELWELARSSDLLVYFVPTYGGMPPATWVAFQQRFTGIFGGPGANPQPPGGKIAFVTIFEPMATPAGDISQRMIDHYVAGQSRTLLGYEPIIPSAYGLKGLQDRLVQHPAIQARIDHLATSMVRAL